MAREAAAIGETLAVRSGGDWGHAIDRYAAGDPHRQLVHRTDARLLEQVPVEIGRELDAGVPELLAAVFDRLALVDQQAGVGVAQGV